MDPIVIGVAAFIGGIVGALLGWLDSQEAFNARKFAYSIIHALVAGIVFAVAYGYTQTITIIDIFIAFAAGAGFDATLNRVEGAVIAKLGK